MAICTAVLVSSTLIGPPRIPTSCSHLENSPLAASGIRQAKVRIRKLVKLGTTISASMIAFHFSVTLKTRKYATGNPKTKHSVVAIDRDLQRGLEHGEERRVERIAVVLQRRGGPCRPGRRWSTSVSLAPNEYHTISRIGRMKKKKYQRIDGIASENDGARSRRRRGGPEAAVNMPNAAGGRGPPASDMSTSVAHLASSPTSHHAPAAALTLFMMSTRRSRAGVITWVRIVFTCSSLKKIMSPHFRSGLSSVSS